VDSISIFVEAQEIRQDLYCDTPPHPQPPKNFFHMTLKTAVSISQNEENTYISETNQINSG
jgi:hypothetical protein